jgi:hypothetical protein
MSLSSSESDDPSTGESLSLALKEKDDIVIKSTDKGSAFVVMDKVDYLEEANRQLTNERFYKKLDSDPTEEFSTKITQELKIIETRMVPEGRGFMDSIF